MPERLQLSRKKGYRLPLGAKSVARPSKWGNPFRMVRVNCPGPAAGMCWEVSNGKIIRPHIDSELEARRRAVELFEQYLPDHWRGRRGLIAVELRGLHLACWCPLPEPGEIDWCHARVLLDEANS